MDPGNPAWSVMAIELHTIKSPSPSIPILGGTGQLGAAEPGDYRAPTEPSVRGPFPHSCPLSPPSCFLLCLFCINPSLLTVSVKT